MLTLMLLQSRTICLIHLVKGSKIMMITREKKRVYCAGILLLENMTRRIGGRPAVLSSLGLIRASTSITPSLALLPGKVGRNNSTQFSNIIEIKTNAKQTFDPRNCLLLKRNKLAYSKIFSRLKQNELSILEIF